MYRGSGCGGGGGGGIRVASFRKKSGVGVKKEWEDWSVGRTGARTPLSQPWVYST